ncbi:hypothetical protein B0H13DRAFT_2329236 [Mycena leptocephala]|nr:hypothetical protein B0H13DRAFT_2329236 [Mycena leptocephala]
MSGSPRGSKRKSSAGGSGRANTKRARGTNAKGKAPDVGGAANTSSTGAAPGDAAGAASAEKDKEENETRARRRNPHGIAPDDVDDKAKPTQRAFQRHIRMAAGLLIADAVLEPADDYIDHYDKRFNESDDMEGLMRQIVAEAKKPNKDAQKRAERLIRDAKVIARGEGEQPGQYGQIAKDISLMPAEHIAFFYSAVIRSGLKAFHPDVFGPTHSTYNQLHRHLAVSTFRSIAGWYGYTALNVSLTIADDYHLLSEMYDNFMFGTIKTNSHKENNSPGSLSKALDTSKVDKRRIQLCVRRYKEAKARGYRKPILRLLKVKAAHSDDERPPGGDAKKKKGLNICTRTAGARLLPLSVPEMRTVTDPPTPSSALSRVLPVGVPIDFWDPKFYNKELDVQEKAIKWAKMPAKEFMEKYGNEVLAQYNLPTPEEIAALGLDKDSDEGSDADDESTDLEDTDEEGEAMHE